MSWLTPVITPDDGAEVISLADAKKHLRVLPEDTDEDIYIGDLIDAAVGHVASITGRVVHPSAVELTTNSWGDVAVLPVAPVHTLTIEVDGEPVDPDIYDFDPDPFSPRILLRFGKSWPTKPNGYTVKIVAAAGFQGAVPPAMKQAAMLLIGQWFRNRTPAVSGRFVTELPHGVDALLTNHRRNL